MGIQSSSSRPGVAKDQLIFIIICSVALAVAAVTMVHFFTGGGKKTMASEWQCLDCDKTFSMKGAFTPPVKCKCGGEAVRLGYRVCQSCGEKVLAYRIRMPEQAEGAATGPGGPPGMGMMGMPTDMQFRIKLEDGTDGWTDWISAGSPQGQQMSMGMPCPECGNSMFSAAGSRR